MEESENTLPPRSLVEILNETFVVYGRNLRKIILVSAIVNAPLSIVLDLWLLNFGYATTLGENSNPVTVSLGGAITMLGLIVLWVMGSVFAYAAIAAAVGQYYLTGNVNVGACYSRVGWRAISLAVLGIGSALALIAAFFVLATLGIVIGIIVIPGVLVVGLLIYLIGSFSADAILVEGYKPRVVLARTLTLIQGDWTRILLSIVAVFLVAFGLSILLTAPLGIVTSLLGLLESSTMQSVVLVIANLITFVAVPPVIFIAGTLLYFDLRVKKENFDVETLSQEIGIAKALR